MTVGQGFHLPSDGVRLHSFCSSFAATSLLSVSTTREGAGTSDTPVPGQIRLAARTPCNKWAGALPPRGARSREALAGLWLPETRPHRPKNRLGVTASARAGGRRAGPGPPGSLLSGRPSTHPCPRVAGAAPGTRRAPGSELAPRAAAPHPHSAPRRRSARRAALHRESRRKGKETEAGTGASAEAQALRGGSPTASRLPGRSGPRAGRAAADAGGATPGCSQPATLRRCPSWGTSPAPGSREDRGGAGRRAAGPGGGGRRGAYLPWCCRGRAAAAAAGWWPGETGRGEGARPARRRGGSGVAARGALIAAVTWPRTLRALGRSLPTQGPRGRRPAAPGDPGSPSAPLPLRRGSGSSSPAPPGVGRWGTCRGARVSPARDLGGDSRADGSISGNRLPKTPRVRGT